MPQLVFSTNSPADRIKLRVEVLVIAKAKSSGEMVRYIACVINTGSKILYVRNSIISYSIKFLCILFAKVINFNKINEPIARNQQNGDHEQANKYINV